MSKIKTIAQREYMYYLRKPSFLFAAFGVPLLVIVVFILIIIVAVESTKIVDLEGEARYGYVDHADPPVISDEVLQQQDYGHLFTRFDHEESARVALDDRANTHVEAYFVVAEDYMLSGDVQLYSYGGLPRDLEEYINRLLIASISARVEANENIEIPAARIAQPVELTVRLEDSGRELKGEGFIPLFIMPIAFAIVFTLAAQMTGGFLMSGLVEEKTNRIMEILVTSVTPLQMLAGKIIGLGLLGLTQLAVWLAAALAILVFGGDRVDFLEGIAIPVDLMVVAVIFFLLGYSLTATLMAGVGAVVGSEQESRQYAGVITMILFIPYFFMITFIENPDGAIPVILSLFPFTAPMAMIMRFGFTAVPLWQLGLSVALLLLTTVFVAWLSAKIFRWGLLMYGKRLRPRDLIRAFRSRGDMGTAVSDVQAVTKEVRT